MLKRTIEINVINGSAMPGTRFAGYAGEHLATRLEYDLPQEFTVEGLSYELAFETAGGKSFYAPIAKAPVMYDLPQGLMAEGRLCVQLTVLKAMEIIYKTNVVDMTIRKSIIPSDEVSDKYLGLLEDSIAKFNEANKNPPRIGKNGNWEWYSLESKEYVDSGASAIGEKGDTGEPGKDGKNGDDGFSPSVIVLQTETGAVITTTDKSGTAEAVINHGKDLTILTETELPANNTLVPQTEYYLGNADTLTLHFPQTAQLGQECYVTFNSGESPTVLAVDTTNTTPLTLVPSANSICEISAKWNGTVWVLLTSEVKL